MLQTQNSFVGVLLWICPKFPIDVCQAWQNGYSSWHSFVQKVLEKNVALVFAGAACMASMEMIGSTWSCLTFVLLASNVFDFTKWSYSRKYCIVNERICSDYACVQSLYCLRVCVCLTTKLQRTQNTFVIYPIFVINIRILAGKKFKNDYDTP